MPRLFLKLLLLVTGSCLALGAQTLSQCGNGSSLASFSTNSGGTITIGQSAGNVCTLNFSPSWASAPSCQAITDSVSSPVHVDIITTSFVRFQTAFTGATQIYYQCNNGASSGSGTVTNVSTSSPLSGGPVTSTGTIACTTCATTTNGGALTATAPVAISAGGVISGGGLGTVTGALKGNGSGVITQAGCADLTIPCITGNQTITLSGDVTGSGTTAIAATAVKLNGGVVPASQGCVGTNGSSQLIAGTCTGVGIAALKNAAATVACDGATDDTAVWNTLIAVSGSIIIAPINCTSIVTNVTGFGNGVTILCAGTTFKAKAATTGVVINIGGTGNTLQACTLDGNSQDGVTYLVQATNATNATLRSNTLKTAGTPGAANFAGGINYFQSSGAIEDNVISQIAGYCSILTNPAGATTYSHNHLDHCYKDGLVVSGAVGNVTVDNNVIQYVYDYDNSSFGAYGNGIYLNSGTSYVNVTGNKISYTTYGGIRVASSSKNNVSINNIDHSGEEGIFLQDFGGGNNNATGNTISDALSMCIDVANAGDNAAFGSNVSGNSCYNAMGVSTNGATTPKYGVCYYGDAWVNFGDNTCNGAYYGIVCDNGEGGTYVNYHCVVQGNVISDTRPVTLNLSGASGNCRTAASGAPTEYGFLTSGTNLNSASKSAIILTCQAATNPTWVTVTMIKGWFAAADGLTVVNTAGTSQFTATVSSVVGPGNDNLTLSSVTNFNIFDTVHIGNATGIITCSSVIFATTPCAANHIVVSRTLNGSSFVAAFPASGTLTDDTTSATATITARVATPENLQTAIAANAGDTTSGQCTNNVASIIIRNNITSGFEIADIDGISGGSLTSLGSGTCVTR